MKILIKIHCFTVAFGNTDFGTRILGLNQNLKLKHAVICEVSVMVLIYSRCHVGAQIKPLSLLSKGKPHFSLKLVLEKADILHKKDVL